MLTSLAMYSFGATCWTPSGKQNIPRFLLEGRSLTVLFGLSCLQVISAESAAILATKKDSKDISVSQQPAGAYLLLRLLQERGQQAIIFCKKIHMSHGAMCPSQLGFDVD